MLAQLKIWTSGYTILLLVFLLSFTWNNTSAARVYFNKGGVTTQFYIPEFKSGNIHAAFEKTSGLIVPEFMLNNLKSLAADDKDEDLTRASSIRQPQLLKLLKPEFQPEYDIDESSSDSSSDSLESIETDKWIPATKKLDEKFASKVLKSAKCNPFTENPEKNCFAPRIRKAQPEFSNKLLPRPLSPIRQLSAPPRLNFLNNQPLLIEKFTTAGNINPAFSQNTPQNNFGVNQQTINRAPLNQNFGPQNIQAAPLYNFEQTANEPSNNDYGGPAMVPPVLNYDQPAPSPTPSSFSYLPTQTVTQPTFNNQQELQSLVKTNYAAQTLYPQTYNDQLTKAETGNIYSQRPTPSPVSQGYNYFPPNVQNQQRNLPYAQLQKSPPIFSNTQPPQSIPSFTYKLLNNKFPPIFSYEPRGKLPQELTAILPNHPYTQPRQTPPGYANYPYSQPPQPTDFRSLENKIRRIPSAQQQFPQNQQFENQIRRIPSSQQQFPQNQPFDQIRRIPNPQQQFPQNQPFDQIRRIPNPQQQFPQNQPFDQIRRIPNPQQQFPQNQPFDQIRRIPNPQQQFPQNQQLGNQIRPIPNPQQQFPQNQQLGNQIRPIPNPQQQFPQNQQLENQIRQIPNPQQRFPQNQPFDQIRRIPNPQQQFPQNQPFDPIRRIPNPQQQFPQNQQLENSIRRIPGSQQQIPQIQPFDQIRQIPSSGQQFFQNQQLENQIQPISSSQQPAPLQTSGNNFNSLSSISLPLQTQRYGEPSQIPLSSIFAQPPLGYVHGQPLNSIPSYRYGEPVQSSQSLYNVDQPLNNVRSYNYGYHDVPVSPSLINYGSPNLIHYYNLLFYKDPVLVEPHQTSVPEQNYVLLPQQ